MKVETDRRAVLAYLSAMSATLRDLPKGRRLTPKLSPAFRALWRRVAWQKILLCLGFVVQTVLLLLLWQLIELIISLFEVWALLARHSLGL